MITVLRTTPLGQPFALCEMCSLQAPHAHGEWQCWQCTQWYYSYTLLGHTYIMPVYDRVVTPEQITQQHQCVLDEARRFLEAKGQRYTIDFGWRDAMAKAKALGYLCRDDAIGAT